MIQGKCDCLGPLEDKVEEARECGVDLLGRYLLLVILAPRKKRARFPEQRGEFAIVFALLRNVRHFNLKLTMFVSNLYRLARCSAPTTLVLISS